MISMDCFAPSTVMGFAEGGEEEEGEAMDTRLEENAVGPGNSSDRWTNIWLFRDRLLLLPPVVIRSPCCGGTLDLNMAMTGHFRGVLRRK
jgi:hypothetical protein